VRKQVDEEGNVVAELGGEKRFQMARLGDHLMSLFQCKLCHCRNIQQRDPTHIAASIENSSSISEELYLMRYGQEKPRL
jgi:hypothetical protein